MCGFLPPSLGVESPWGDANPFWALAYCHACGAIWQEVTPAKGMLDRWVCRRMQGQGTWYQQGLSWFAWGGDLQPSGKIAEAVMEGTDLQNSVGAGYAVNKLGGECLHCAYSLRHPYLGWGWDGK